MTYFDDVSWSLRCDAVARAGRDELLRRAWERPCGADRQRRDRAAWLMATGRNLDALAVLEELTGFGRQEDAGRDG